MHHRGHRLARIDQCTQEGFGEPYSALVNSGCRFQGSELDHLGWVFGGYIIVKWLLLQATACDMQNKSVGHQLKIRVHFATAHLLPDAIGTYFGKGTDTLVFEYVSPKWYSDTHGGRCGLELVGLIFLSLK